MRAAVRSSNFVSRQIGEPQDKQAAAKGHTSHGRHSGRAAGSELQGFATESKGGWSEGQRVRRYAVLTICEGV